MNLKGTPILVTRPQPEARGTAALINASNGFPIIQPGVIIECAQDAESLAPLERLETFNSAIFTSTNAVRCALGHRPRRDWPPEVKIYAVGQSTRRSLLNAGFPAVTAPTEGGGSEALLAAVDWAEMGSTLIIAAPGGRELLAQRLEEAGNQVTWCYAYRRRAAKPTEQTIRQVRSQWGRLVVIATSEQILKNVKAMFDGLTTRPLVVPSARLRDAARDMGFAYIAVSSRPNDESLLEAAGRFIE